MGHHVERELARCACGKEGQHCPGQHGEQCCQQVQGGDFSPQLSSGETTSAVLCLVLGSPVEGRHGLNGVGPEKGYKDD